MLKRLNLYTVVYSVVIFAFCFYWATNFSRHTTNKGDEFTMLVEILLTLTYIFYFTIQLSVKWVNLAFALVVPVVIVVVSFCIGVLIFLVSGLSGIPREYILLYGLLHGLLSVLAAYAYWGRALRKRFDASKHS